MVCQGRDADPVSDVTAFSNISCGRPVFPDNVTSALPFQMLFSRFEHRYPQRPALYLEQALTFQCETGDPERFVKVP